MISDWKTEYNSHPGIPRWATRPRPATLRPASTDNRLSQTADQFTGSCQAASAGAGTAHVTVKPMPAGLDGELITVQRTSSVSASVTLDYSSFRDAVGGDWASRLRLSRLPECAVTTPDKPECLASTPLPSTNNTAMSTLSADVTLPASKTPIVLSPRGRAPATAAATSPRHR